MITLIKLIAIALLGMVVAGTTTFAFNLYTVLKESNFSLQVAKIRV